MVTTATKPKPAATAATPTAEAVSHALRAYQIEKPDPATGELVTASRFKYLTGHPRQIRADLKAGSFNINGETPLGKTLSFIPLAWRFFQDNILNMGRKTWAEIFFVDKTGAVCAVLFHGYSVENLLKLNAGLFYDDLTLADVVLTVTPSKKESKQEKGGSYYIAEFSYEAAPADEVKARREFVADFLIYREETVTGEAEVSLFHGYQLPEHHEPQRRALPAVEEDSPGKGGAMDEEYGRQLAERVAARPAEYR
ncbi:MAG: hypothetical protein H7330_00220 [Hymenobacteraceae bacterium]|nr:hypothetical protein [Hymenobacteraceae bacterium]